MTQETQETQETQHTRTDQIGYNQIKEEDLPIKVYRIRSRGVQPLVVTRVSGYDSYTAMLLDGSHPDVNFSYGYWYWNEAAARKHLVEQFMFEVEQKTHNLARAKQCLKEAQQELEGAQNLLEEAVRRESQTLSTKTSTGWTNGRKTLC